MAKTRAVVVVVGGKSTLRANDVGSFYPLGRASHVMNKVLGSRSSARLAVTKQAVQWKHVVCVSPDTRFLPHHPSRSAGSRTNIRE